MNDTDLIRKLAGLSDRHEQLIQADLRDGTPESFAAVVESYERIKALQGELSEMHGPPADVSGFAGRWGGNVVGQADGRKARVDMHKFMGVSRR